MTVDQTLPAEADPAGEERFSAWDRYAIGEQLGQGGMGVVFRATDLRLGRDVAIKLIRGGDPELTMRLVREARAQARIDHVGVCRVYEVGEHAGRAYIALQLVNGVSLAVAAPTMSLEEKITVVRDVAIAIHEAHRLGIVHRDLKPANVMVERSDRGLQPIVMDFGVASQADVESGLTRSGALIGTPSYMSPEQARGDVRAIDRRSDVYGLGATLYEMLTGRPPFSSTSLATALEHAIHHEPVPPRKLQPTLPADLETIAMKCMRKDPGSRYASARALATDLTRFLDGEPIEGRRPTLADRVRSSIRKHPGLYAVVALAMVMLTATAALYFRDHVRGRARIELSERLARDARDIELLARSTYLLPLHDTRPERLTIRLRVMALAMTDHDLGEAGDALVHDVVGRAHFALHEYADAVRELTLAETAGLDTAELHATKGRALGEVYRHELEQSRRAGDNAWLVHRAHELEGRFLAPAVVELTRAGEQGELLEAEILLDRHDYAAAKAKAMEVATETPWIADANKLAADAVYASAVADLDTGAYDAARTQLDEASQLYARAAEIARSDAGLHEARAMVLLKRAEIDQRQNRDSKSALDQAGGAIDRAIVADPRSESAYTTKAYILLQRSRTSVDGDDRRPALDAAADAAERALALDGTDAGAWDTLGNAHVVRGAYEQRHGGAGEAWWRRAIREFEQALELRPDDPWANNDLGIARRWLANLTAATSGDPLPEYRAALDAYRRARTIDPSYLYAWSNEADLFAQLAEYQLDAGADPRVSAQQAIEAAEHGLALDPHLVTLLWGAADGALVEATYRVHHRADPTAAISSARRYLERADRIRPGDAQTLAYRAIAARLEVEWDPKRSLADVRAADAKLLAVAPDASTWGELAQLALDLGNLDAARHDLAMAHTEDDSTLDTLAAEVELAAHERAAGLAFAERAVAEAPHSARARAAHRALLATQR